MGQLENAIALAAKGFHVFPLREGSKLPQIKGYPKEATRDPHRIYEWWGKWPNANVGISTSHNLLVVDIDVKEGVNGDEAILELEFEGFELPETYTQSTPTGGRHLVYSVEAPVKQGTAVLGRGVDIRARGGFIVGAGSVLESGAYGCEDRPVVPAPGWLVDRCQQAPEKSEPTPVPENLNEDRATQRARYYLEHECPTAAAGERNDAGYRAAAKMKDFGVSRATCLDLMLSLWPCEPMLDDDEMEHVVNSAYQYGQQPQGASAPEAQFQPVANTRQSDTKAKDLQQADDLIVDIVFPHKFKNGGLRGTILNLRALLDGCKIRVGYNVIAKRTEINNPHTRHVVDGSDNTALSYVTSLAAQVGMPIGEIPRYIDAIARDPDNVMNPARDFVRAVEWDGTDHFSAFVASTKGPEPKLTRELLWRWMISAVAAIERPTGVAAQGVLVLCGPQGAGKSRWVESLAPSDLILPGALLNPNDRDSVYNAVRHWIVEIGELDATFRKTDLAQLKAFVTRDKDSLRQPYDKLPETYARRTVFAATVNGNDFLSDPTGNRRYWTVPVEWIDLDHGIDVRAVWAQVAAAYDRGEHWHLTADEEVRLAALNNEHTLHDPLEDLILARFDPADKDRSEFLTATDVARRLGYANPDRSRTAAAAQALRAHFGERKTVQGRRGWWMPRHRFDQEVSAVDATDIFS